MPSVPKTALVVLAVWLASFSVPPARGAPPRPGSQIPAPAPALDGGAGDDLSFEHDESPADAKRPENQPAVSDQTLELNNTTPSPLIRPPGVAAGSSALPEQARVLITTLQQTIERDERQLANLKAELASPRGEYDKARAAFKKLAAENSISFRHRPTMETKFKPLDANTGLATSGAAAFVAEQLHQMQEKLQRLLSADDNQLSQSSPDSMWSVAGDPRMMIWADFTTATVPESLMSPPDATPDQIEAIQAAEKVHLGDRNGEVGIATRAGRDRPLFRLDREIHKCLTGGLL